MAGLGVHGHLYLTDLVSVHLPLATSPEAPQHWQSHRVVPIQHVTIGPGLVNGCFTGTNMAHLHSANWAISTHSNVHKTVHPPPFLFTCILLMIEQLLLDCPTSANTQCFTLPVSGRSHQHVHT
jgi:hypothetical protein